MTVKTEPPNVTQPRIEHRPAQAYLGIPRRVTNGVPNAVDSAFPELIGWLSEHDVQPSGPPFIRTSEVDALGEPLELEVAVPVETAVPAGGAVHAGVLPEGRYMTMRHVGPYRSTSEPDLGDARNVFVRWAAEHGVTYSRETDRGAALPCSVEHLLVSPGTESDWTKWKTEFAYLVIED